ncbi:MAG TPA: ABC transporter permease [Methylomirabilota bacterium]|nr:ABC transporter permease [Methylomirabilota bacterium]
MTVAGVAAIGRGGISKSRQRGFGIFYLVLAAVIVLVFGQVEAGAQTTFGLNIGKATVPDLVIPSAATAYFLAALAAMAGVIQLTRGFGTRWAIVLALVISGFAFGFLTWAGSGGSMSLAGILQTSLQRSVPITFGAMSGILCERAGVVNIAIEGMLLSAAFTSAVVASATANPWIGIVAGIVTGGLMAALLAVLAIRYLVDQIIAGVVINILVVGITSFLSARVLAKLPDLNNPERLGPVAIPFLSDLPVVGGILFRQNIFIYACVAAIFILHYMLFSTRWGLRVRAVGEHPKAADTVGINVFYVRYRNVILGGMLAGLGGAYFTLGSTGSFQQEMTAGRGFIGLAAMIFGGWAPFGAFLAGIVFGFAEAVQSRLSILNIGLPSQFLQMVPYLVTIIVVAGLVGRVRAPAADGRPYKKE